MEPIQVPTFVKVLELTEEFSAAAAAAELGEVLEALHLQELVVLEEIMEEEEEALL